MQDMHGIDKYDYDVKENEERIHVPFTLNFKSISNYMLALQEGMKEHDDEYPKKELWRLTVAIWVIFFILIVFSYNAFVVITIPFMLFYFLALRSIYKTWKMCGYSKAQFIIPFVVIVLAAIPAAYFIQEAIFY